MVSRLLRVKLGQPGLCVGLLLLVVQSVSAVEDVSGASDLESVMRYPNAWIVDYSHGSAPEYRLATGSMKKINGVISPEFQQDLSGMLTRITYQLPSGHSSVDAFNHFKRQFDGLSPELLFSCEGRGCGDSNQWANVQFGISRLYGIDREQYYLALKLPARGAEPSSYLAFYTVMRGNKRVYAQLDLIQPASRSASQRKTRFIAALEQRERVFRQSDKLTQEELDSLKQLMMVRSSLVLTLVGHSDQGTSLEEQRTDSLRQAETMKQELVAQGLDGSKLSVHGVGSLAPAYDRSIPARRVELLLGER